MIQTDWINDTTTVSTWSTPGMSNTILPSITTTNMNSVLTSSVTTADWITIANPPNSLDVKGDANFEGDVKLKGKSLLDTLEGIEKRLGILHPNHELEEKWERLKSLGDMYRELEQEILEKEKIWSVLKK